MTNTTWHSTAALTWLQTLLQERFGHVFHLQVQPGCTRMALHLQGDTRCITLTLDSTTFTRADSDLPCAQWNASAEGCITAMPTNLPAPGVAHLPSPLVTATENGWYIGYDILGMTYWMLTRQEEVGRTDLDSHGRFPAVASHAYRHGYIERPIVDEWLHFLGQMIARTWPSLMLKPQYFTMKVSHDVDSPSLYAFKNWTTIGRIMAGSLLKRRDFKAFVMAPYLRLVSQSKLHPVDPYNTFEWIMDMSDKHGLTSAFYFICGRTNVNKDADYEPEHPVIRELMRRIHHRGHEIGLHPSYATYNCPSAIQVEAKRLRAVTASEGIHQHQWGARMHYLRWRHPNTMYGLEAAGINYDSTLGYADRPGFRCGTCFEYPAFDPVNLKIVGLRIRPLIVMEGSVISDIYLNLGVGQVARKKLMQLKDACIAVNGCFTVLWHNSSLVDERLKTLYSEIL